jgi:hypothetical protein
MTSLGVNYSSSSASSRAPGTAVNFLPFTPQHDSFICLNPSGLPAGTYRIEQISEDIANPLANIEWALDLSSNAYFVRHCTAVGPPATWGVWSQISSGVFPPGVISFNARTGVVTSVTGDYNAGQVTNVPTGNISAVNVQSALNQISIFCPPPMATANASAVAIAPGAWTALPSVYAPAQSRSTQSGGTWAAAVDGITVNGSGAGVQFVNLTAEVTTAVVAPAADSFGVRIVAGGGGPVACSINPNDMTGGLQNISCGVINRSNVGVTYSLEVINNSLGPINFSGILYIEYLG